MRSLPPTALALLLALAACDSSAPQDGPLVANTFSVQVGDGEPVVRTEAHFGSYVSATTGATVAMVLGTRPVGSLASITAPVVGFAYDGASVSVGSYDLAAVNPSGDPPEGMFIGVYIDPAEYVSGQIGRSGFYYTGEGTITFDEVDATHARGSFSMRAVELGDGFAASEAAVEVSGEFHAVHTDAFGNEDAIWN
ncbi:hypothetical protein [Rubrivirga marina]|uniref:Transferrin-binding protein B C-lobe/N-lobe beta barrel domain-containing protein n=1 Tax=Rubrivirga marina TaxID=1196024 RepID=A0A271IZR9_9BACT|nr:hypothetical protein [Rubrivirga marina]PAP76205.1 hypothetical protein BSZ37_06980 [Rubrivirga marina]